MIISFYTPGYAEEAAALRQSAERLGYQIEITAIEEQGGWEANCAMKSRVVRDALKKYEQVLFLDADARIQAPIDDLLKPHDGIRLHIVTADQFKPGWFAQRYRYHAVKHGMWNSGVMSIRRSPEVMQLMDAWVEMVEKRPGEWDQLCLQWAHIESGSTIPVIDLPSIYRAGRASIGHKSAFHKYWRTDKSVKTVRKVLLLGSADYLPQWWASNRDKYLNKGFQIVAVNNACEVAGDDLHLWLIPNDYQGKCRADHIPNNHPGYPRATNKEGNWIHRPLWVRKPSTIVFSALSHMLNEALLDGCELEVHLAGCDMIYKSGKTHFYGRGTPDPLRFSDSELKEAQGKIQNHYAAFNSKIFNAGGQPETRLIFPAA